MKTFHPTITDFQIFYWRLKLSISSYIFKIKTLGYIQKIQSFNTTKLSKPQDFSFSLFDKYTNKWTKPPSGVAPASLQNRSRHLNFYYDKIVNYKKPTLGDNLETLHFTRTCVTHFPHSHLWKHPNIHTHMHTQANPMEDQ